MASQFTGRHPLFCVSSRTPLQDQPSSNGVIISLNRVIVVAVSNDGCPYIVQAATAIANIWPSARPSTSDPSRPPRAAAPFTIAAESPGLAASAMYTLRKCSAEFIPGAGVGTALTDAQPFRRLSAGQLASAHSLHSMPVLRYGPRSSSRSAARPCSSAAASSSARPAGNRGSSRHKGNRSSNSRAPPKVSISRMRSSIGEPNTSRPCVTMSVTG